MGTSIELPGVARITQTGQTQLVTLTTGTAPTAIPLNSNSGNPRVVRVMVNNICHLRFSTAAAGQTAAATDMLLTPNGGPEYYNTTGLGFYSACLNTQSATTAILSIVPVEL